MGRAALLKTRQAFQRVRLLKLLLLSPPQTLRPGGKELKAQRKEFKAKAQGNQNQAQGNENQAQGNENKESSFFNRLCQILVPSSPFTLTFCGSRGLKGTSVQHEATIIPLDSDLRKQLSTPLSTVGVTLGCAP
jgi:hypothetical protein